MLEKNTLKHGNLALGVSVCFHPISRVPFALLSISSNRSLHLMHMSRHFYVFCLPVPKNKQSTMSAINRTAKITGSL